MIKVAYLGPKGTFSEEAAQALTLLGLNRVPLVSN